MDRKWRTWRRRQMSMTGSLSSDDSEAVMTVLEDGRYVGCLDRTCERRSCFPAMMNLSLTAMTTAAFCIVFRIAISHNHQGVFLSRSRHFFPVGVDNRSRTVSWSTRSWSLGGRSLYPSPTPSSPSLFIPFLFLCPFLSLLLPDGLGSPSGRGVEVLPLIF